MNFDLLDFAWPGPISSKEMTRCCMMFTTSIHTPVHILVLQAAHQTDQGNLPEKRTVNQGVCCIGSWLEAGEKTMGSC